MEKRRLMRPRWISCGVIAAVVILVLMFGNKDVHKEKSGITKDQAKVTLGNYKGIEITTDDPEVTDEEIKQAVQGMLDAWNAEAPSDKTTVESGDTVMCAVHGTMDDGTEIDGADAQGFITPGTGQTYKEVEQALIGMNVGEEKTVAVTLPDPYAINPELSGKKASMDVLVQYIKSDVTLSLDTLTDEQAAEAFSADGVKTVQDLYDMTRKIVAQDKKATIRQEAYEKICNHLLETCTVDPFPDTELDSRLNEQMGQMSLLCESYYGMTMEAYLKQTGMTEEEYRKQTEDELRDTIKLELIFMAVAEKEGISYPEGAFDDYVEDILAQTVYETREELFSIYDEDYIKLAFHIEYVVDWLIDNADMVYIE